MLEALQLKYKCHVDALAVLLRDKASEASNELQIHFQSFQDAFAKFLHRMEQGDVKVLEGLLKQMKGELLDLGAARIMKGTKFSLLEMENLISEILLKGIRQ